MTKKFLGDNWPQGSKQLSRCAGGRLEFDLGQDLFLKKPKLSALRTKPLRYVSNRDINKRRQRIKGLFVPGERLLKVWQVLFSFSRELLTKGNRSHHGVGMAGRPGVQITLTRTSQLPQLSWMLSTTCKLSIAAVTRPASLSLHSPRTRKKEPLPLPLFW